MTRTDTAHSHGRGTNRTGNDESPRALADGGRVEGGEGSGRVLVSVSRRDLAGVADALDAERETVRRHAGDGPRTERLARLVAKCRTTLSIGGHDEAARLNRPVAADAATMLRTAAETEVGEYAEELRTLADSFQEPLEERSG